MLQKRSNPLKDPELADRFGRLIIRHMIRLGLSDEQLLAILKDVAGLTRGSLSSIRRHKDGSGGLPTTQTIGAYQKALRIPDEEIDQLLYPDGRAAVGLPALRVLHDQFQELVAELKRRSNLPYEVELARAAARVALEEENFEKARVHLTSAAEATRRTAEHAAEEYARSLASLGALALAESDFDEARIQFELALALPGLSEERLHRYQRSYLIASTAVIARSEGFKEAQDVFDHVLTMGIRPDLFVFNAMMARAFNFKHASNIFNDMEQYGVRPNTWTINTLMSKTNDCNTARNLFDLIEAQGLTPDDVSFRTLMSKTDSYKDAKSILDIMINNGIDVDVRSYNTLMSKAKNYNESFNIADVMRKRGVSPDVVTFNTLMSRVNDYERAEILYKEMEAAQVAPDIWTFNVLLAKAENYADATTVLGMIGDAKLTPDKVTFRTLLSKTQNESQATFVLRQMQEANIAPDIKSFNQAMRRAESYAAAAAMCGLLSRSNLKTNKESFRALMSRAESYEQAGALLLEMREAGIVPDIGDFNRLMSKATSYDQAVALLNDTREAELSPDRGTYCILMSKAKTRADAAHGLTAWKSWGQSADQVFRALTAALSEKMSAEMLFETCFGVARDLGINFPSSTFQAAIEQYVSCDKISDALRVGVAFPHLPSVSKLMSFFPEEAEAAFRRHFTAEPHHSSYALARLFEATGQFDKMREWARVALEQDRQPPPRLDDIQRMLSVGR